MNPRIKKWIFRPFPILLITFFVVIVAGIMLLASQQQRLVNLAIRELNKQFKGDFTLEKSNLSLFRNFPYVSIGLHETRLFSDKSHREKPICEFESIYIGFSLPDIIRKEYNLKRLSLHGGYVDLVRDSDDKINIMEAIHIQDSTSSQSTDTVGFDIDLRKIVFKDLTFSFLDKASGKKISARLEELTSSFKMDSTLLTVEVDSEMEMNFTSPADTSFFRHKQVKLDIEADYKKKSKLLEITTGSLKLQDASFKVEGSADLSEESKVDFRIKGDEPDFSLIAAFLPGDVKKILEPFKYDGQLHFDGIIKGEISKGQTPLVEISFGCKDAWFLNTGAGRKIDQLGFKGFFTNGSEHSLRTSELHIINLNARPEKGVFKGNFVVRDFVDPHTLVQINSELELKFLGEFLGIQGLKQTTGTIKLDMDFKDLIGIELPEQSLNKLKEGIQSKLSVTGLSFNIPGYPLPVRDMNLHAEMKDGRVTLDSVFLRIGNSDLHLDGSLSDIHAFLHNFQDKAVTLTLNARSNRIVVDELLSYDTALAHKMKEEISGFKVGLTFETSVHQLLNPAPLPKGKFEMKNLWASFKEYPHKFKDLAATVMIDDTVARLRHFTGVIDSSDFNFSGRVKNYQLWFEKIMIGKTQIAFDFKSTHFSLHDILSLTLRTYIPKGYRREIGNNVWVRSKIDMRYDTSFKFAKAEIVNLTADLKKHNLKLKDIKGKVKYGLNRVLILDSLRGNIGRSDFEISLRLFAGADKKMKKKTNSLQFSSRFLDADEISHVDLGPSKRTKPKLNSDGTSVIVKTDTSAHAKAFNIFMIPFSEFKLSLDISKLKYNQLWVKDINLQMRMQEDHFIYVDTLDMKIAGGTVGMTGNLNGSNPNEIFFNSIIDVEQIDLEKMLIKLDHFGQDIVINKNIKGKLSGRIKSYVQVHPNLVPIMSKTEAHLDIRIYNGSLVDFAPMQAMAGYFKDKNLRMVRFDTLKNELTFSNSVLSIPSMSINSSLGFIQMSGKQSLDLDMEYYVRVPLKLVTKVGFSSLFDKKEEDVDLNQVDAIEYQDASKKIRFMNLKVTGTPEDFKVGLGRDKTRY